MTATDNADCTVSNALCSTWLWSWAHEGTW